MEGNQLACHASLLEATNREAIVDAVKAVRDALGTMPPIILEGDYLRDVPFRSERTSPLKAVEELELVHTAAENMRNEREWLLDKLA